MKKSFLLTLLLLGTLPFLFSFKTTSVHPDGHEGIKVISREVPNKRSMVLQAYNLQQKPTRIIIHNASGETVFTKKILRHNGYKELINLSRLPLGQYRLMVLHPHGSKYANIDVKRKSAVAIWETKDS